MEFKCFDCNLVFTAEGTRVEYRDPIYGPCAKTVASCPQCGGECTDFRRPSRSKSSGTHPEAESCPAYHSGTCSCCH